MNIIWVYSVLCGTTPKKRGPSFIHINGENMITIEEYRDIADSYVEADFECQVILDRVGEPLMVNWHPVEGWRVLVVSQGVTEI